MRKLLPLALVAGGVVLTLVYWPAQAAPRRMDLPYVDAAKMYQELEQLRPLVQQFEAKSQGERVAGLASADGNTRLAAIIALTEQGPHSAEAVPALIGNLESSVEDLRLHAALALGRIGAPALPALRDSLRSTDAEVRYHALLALSLLGESARPAAGQVLAALKDPDEAVRHKAAYALGKILPESPEAVPALVAALEDKHEDVRQEASNALVQFRGRAAPVLVPLLKGKEQLRDLALAALAQMGPDAAPAVAGLRDLAKTQPNLRPQALQTLTAIGKPAMPALEELMRGGDPATKQLILQMLWAHAADGIDIILESLKDESVEVRRQGLQLLANANIADKRVVLHVADVVGGDKDATLRQQAAYCLANLGPAAKAGVPALTKAQNDSQPGVRQAATHALQMIQGR